MNKDIIHLNLTADKINNEIAFNEEHHKYWNTKHADRSYISVTTIIGMYHSQFDGEFWSKYKTLQKLADPDAFNTVKHQLLATNVFPDSMIDDCLIDPVVFADARQELLDEWTETNREACDRGTAYHNKREAEFYVGDKVDVSRYIPMDGQFHCEKGNFDLSRENAVLPEYLVYFSDKEGELHIAGQVDLIIKQGNDVYICDFKTNKKGIETKPFFDRTKKRNQSMFYPINNLDDTTMIHYTLQMSIYAWMLQRINPELNIKMLKLIHISPEEVETEFEVPYLKDEVTRLLLHLREKTKLEKFKKENAKIFQ